LKKIENGDDLMPVDVPIPNIYNSYVMNMLPYKEGFISCGGTGGGYIVELRCRWVEKFVGLQHQHYRRNGQSSVKLSAPLPKKLQD
jgi:hypothetical protein